MRGSLAQSPYPGTAGEAIGAPRALPGSYRVAAIRGRRAGGDPGVSGSCGVAGGVPSTGGSHREAGGVPGARGSCGEGGSGGGASARGRDGFERWTGHPRLSRGYRERRGRKDDGG